MATSYLRVAVPVCRVTGFLHWTFEGAGHEWHLRLPRSAVFSLPITIHIDCCTSNNLNSD